MYLTKEEEKIYDGELGWAYQVSMRILVKLGDLYGAKHLIPVDSAHISGVSYKTIGDAPIEFLRALMESGGKVRVKTTSNPSGIDYENPVFTLIPTDFIGRQREIIDLYKGMGIDASLTCTPYYLEPPKSGVHLSWAESSAVIYANSILNAWTNREGGPSALASALIGKTPDYGLHRSENRGFSALVKVEAKIEGETDYGALGIHLGKVLGDKIPLICGLPSVKEHLLKQMGAAMATSGMIPMYHLNMPGNCCIEVDESITVENKDIRNVYEGLSSASERPDLVFIGCPHCSFSEIKTIAELLRGRKVRSDVKLWVCTSRFIREKAGDYVKIIKSSGGDVICDTCAVVTWLRELGIEVLMTNSAKTAYYTPSMNKAKVTFSTLEDCITTACVK